MRLVLVVLSICSLSLALRQDAFPETKTFTVKAGLQNRKATVTNGDVVCDFRFTTTDCEVKKKSEKEVQKKIDPKKRTDYSAITQLKGKCFTKEIGYWNYEV
jgi:hypothetical protein